MECNLRKMKGKQKIRFLLVLGLLVGMAYSDCNLTVVTTPVNYSSLTVIPQINSLGSVWTSAGYNVLFGVGNLANRDFTSTKGKITHVDSLTDDQIIYFLQENSWFDVKDCFYVNNDAWRPYLVKIKDFRLRTVKKLLIKNFCPGDEVDFIEVSEDQKELPLLLRPFFLGWTLILKCPSKEQVLLVNPIGSDAPTSDFDLSIFIYDYDPEIVLADDIIQVPMGYGKYKIPHKVKKVYKSPYNHFTTSDPWEEPELYEYVYSSSASFQASVSTASLSHEDDVSKITLRGDNYEKVDELTIDDIIMRLRVFQRQIKNTSKRRSTIKDKHALKRFDALTSLASPVFVTNYPHILDERVTLTNLKLVYKLIVDFNKDFSMICRFLQPVHKVDTNIYSDLMVFALVLMKHEDDILFSDITFGSDSKAKQEFEAFQKKKQVYYRSLIFEMMEIAPLLFTENKEILKLHGIDKDFKTHEATLTEAAGIEGDTDEFDAAQNEILTLATSQELDDINQCMSKELENTITVGSTYLFANRMSMCNMYVDEAYMAMGALEYFLFSKKNTFTCHALIEAFIENMSMLIVHLDESMDKPVDSQSISDKFAKYFIRGAGALLMNECIGFGNEKIKHSILDLEEFTKHVAGLIEGDEGEVYVISKKRITKDDYVSQSNFGELVASYFGKDMDIEIDMVNVYSFYEAVLELGEHLLAVQPASDDLVYDKDYHYKSDEEKKQIYLKHYSTFVEGYGLATVPWLIVFMQFFFREVLDFVVQDFAAENVVEWDSWVKKQRIII